MRKIEPEYLSFKYELDYRGAPGIAHDPEDYPLRWKVNVTASIFEDEYEDPDEHVEVGEAFVSVIPHAGNIDLFWTLDAVDQEHADLAEMLTIKRPELLGEAGLHDGAGGDLMYVSSIFIEPEFRGAKLGHTVMDAILRTIGRTCPLVILQAAPVLEEEDAEGTLAHPAAKAALSRYWQQYGFVPAAGDYLAYGDFIVPKPAPTLRVV